MNASEFIRESLTNNLAKLINDHSKEYLIIGRNIYKNIFLEYKAKHPFINLKFIEKNEVVTSLEFDYNNNNLIKYIIHNYGYDYLKSKELLNRLAYISLEDIPYNSLSDKEKKIFDIKKDLISNNLIDLSDINKSECIYKKKNTIIILFDDVSCDKEFINILNRHNITNYKTLSFIDVNEDDVKEAFNNKYYIFKDYIHEFNYVFSTIRKMIIKNHIPPESIYIYMDNLNPFYLKLFSDIYDIPLNFKEFVSYNSNPHIKKLLDYIYSNGEVVPFNSSNEDYSSEGFNDIDLVYSKTIDNIINNFELDKIKDFDKAYLSLVEILSSLKKNENDSNTNGVRVVTNKSFILDGFVFILDFNFGSFYKESKDNGIIEDESLVKFNLKTSYEETLENKRIALYYSLFNNVVFYSRRKFHQEDSIFDSQFVDEYSLVGVEKDINEEGYYTSKAKKLLKTSLFDSLNYYESKEYTDYKSYDNNFKSFPFELKNKISVSNISKYDKCPFQYYVDNYLSVDKFDKSFVAVIGDIFHEVIEEYLKNYKSLKNDDNNLNNLYNDAIKHVEEKGEYLLSNKEKMVLKYSVFPKFRKSFDHVIETYFKVEKESYIDEEKIELPYSIKDKDFIISGRYDLEVNSEEGRKLVDFKTGDVKKYNKNNKKEDIDWIQLILYANYFKNNHSTINSVSYTPILADASHEYIKKLIPVLYEKDEIDSLINEANCIVSKILENMIEGEFSPLGEDNSNEDDSKDSKTCEYCNYSNICYKEKIVKKSY